MKMSELYKETMDALVQQLGEHKGLVDKLEQKVSELEASRDVFKNQLSYCSHANEELLQENGRLKEELKAVKQALKVVL